MPSWGPSAAGWLVVATVCCSLSGPSETLLAASGRSFMVSYPGPGSGKTAAGPEDLGHFADEGGWELVVTDLAASRASVVDLIGREAILGHPSVFGLGGKSVGRPEILGFSAQSDAAFAVWCAVVALTDFTFDEALEVVEVRPLLLAGLLCVRLGLFADVRKF